MRKCDICGKETGNGVTVLVKGGTLNICSKCIVLSDEPLAKKARVIMKTEKKSCKNGKIVGVAYWAAYWTPDCETPKFRKVR